MSRSSCPFAALVVAVCGTTAGSPAYGQALPLGINGANTVVWSTSAGANGHAYEAVLHGSPISWSQANAEALAAGGHLATINDASENAFVFSLINTAQFWSPGLPSDPGHGPWIGAHRPLGSSPGSSWRWVSGEPFAFSPWAPGQPDNAGCGDERYVAYLWTGATSFPLGGFAAVWNDQNNSCPGPISFVVEYEFSLPCTPPPESNVTPRASAYHAASIAQQQLFHS